MTAATPEFGATAWGHAWRRVAEPTTLTRPDSALPRARALARGDAVRDVETDAGRVTAVVVDRAPYAVRLDLPVWDDAIRSRAESLVASSGAGVDSGDLPDDAHERLRAAGLHLAPTADDVSWVCACTSRRRPCVHLLALALTVARLVDERPVLALRLRGAASASTGVARSTRIPLSAIDPATFWGA